LQGQEKKLKKLKKNDKKKKAQSGYRH